MVPAPAPVPHAARWRPSVTVAAVIARSDDEGVQRYLLIEESTSEGLRLNNPAGHLEEGESPEAAVVREALEESAHPFTPTSLVGVYLSRFHRQSTNEDVTYVRFAYAGEVGSAVPGLALDEGIERVVWMTLQEVRDCASRHRSPLVLRCIEDHARGQSFPLSLVHADPSLAAPWAIEHRQA